jgi:C4-dicarboxylate-specific signal transduction histidine kinase
MLTATPLEGGARGAVVAHTDISRRRALEQQEHRRREVMAHSSRLHAVGILASSLVHELTQPLSAATFYIGAAVSMARDNGSDEGLIEVLDGVDAQIRRAGDIVHRLREFMRRRETNLGVVQLDEVIGRALEFVHSLALDKKVQVEVDLRSKVRPVKADPVQVEQVLVNLLCNAIQAVDAGDGQRRLVRVTVVERPEAAEVTVSDTGPGIPPERMERIFDVFETDKPGGMGMGLPISREIVEAHGGRLWAEPDAVGGATFRFNLPLDHEESAP